MWRDKEYLFLEVSVYCSPSPVNGVDVPAILKVLHLPIIFSSISDIMIWDNYDEAMRDINVYSVGHAICHKKCNPS